MDVPESGYWHLLGMRVQKREKGRAAIVLPVTDRLKQLFGVVHGGAIASLIDSVIGLAVSGYLEPGQQAATVEMNVNYLRPVREGRLTATGSIVQRGGRLIVGTADVHNGEGRLVACGRATYIVNQAPEEE